MKSILSRIKSLMASEASSSYPVRYVRTAERTEDHDLFSATIIPARHA